MFHVPMGHNLILPANVPAQGICFKQAQAAFCAQITASIVALPRLVLSVTSNMSLIPKPVYVARLPASTGNTLITHQTHAKLAVRIVPLALALISVRLVPWGSTSETHYVFSAAKERGSKEMHVPTVVSAA